MYEPGSDADRLFEQRMAEGNPLVWSPLRVPDPATQAASDGNSGTGPPNTDETAASGATYNNPQCGQFCYGPNNLCDTSGGCKCIADTFQGPGVAYYTGTCKYTYAALRSGRALLSENLSNTTDKISLLSASPLTLNATTKNTNITTIDLTKLANATEIDATLAANPSEWVAGVEPGVGSGVACPCNCTYVSYGCCDSTTGNVFESVHMRLGAIWMPAGMVCNLTNGEAQRIS